MNNVENAVSSLKIENKVLMDKINRLEAGSKSCKERTDVRNDQNHSIRKRQSGNNKTAATPRAQSEKCASSANLCTYFYPDFPDKYRKKNSSNKIVQSTKDNSSSSPSEMILPKMPSSCKDLQLLGHTLNGFYSVQGKDSNNKIETIFCQFESEQSFTAGGNSTFRNNLVLNQFKLECDNFFRKSILIKRTRSALDSFN